MIVIYLISDGGYAEVKGPNAREMADVLIAVAGYRECSKAEYEAQGDEIAKFEAVECGEDDGGAL